jgi:hypothetical protein
VSASLASATCDAVPLHAIEVSPATLGRGLQLVRASSLTMTRFQLALQMGDRRLATMAMDSLLDLDAEMEDFVAALADAAANEPQAQVMASYLSAQKDAIAREKHALVGQVGKIAPVAAIGDVAAEPDVLELSVAQETEAEPELIAASEGDGPRWLVVALAVCVACAAVAVAVLMLGARLPGW